ncbi:MAG: hypothetical protein QGF46_05110 [Planctomycetota bacterium]|nr:hypothetical protein [Planctomycetota bacterium]
MKVRNSVWLVLALLLTIIFPWLRQLTIGGLLPDLWIVLLLLAVPSPLPRSLRKPVVLTVCLGALRSAVSLPPLLASCAGLFTALLLREQLSRRLSNSLVIYRFFINSVAAIPITLVDVVIANQNNIQIANSDFVWRLFLTGLVLAFAHRRQTSSIFIGRK